MPVELISCGPANAVGSVLLAHGAGADACSPFMEAIPMAWFLTTGGLTVSIFRKWSGGRGTVVLRPRTDLKCCKEHSKRLLINWITNDLW